MQPSQNNNKQSREHPDLERRYGEIGISAVAAALRYGSSVDKPADPPMVAPSWEEREELAA